MSQKLQDRYNKVLSLALVLIDELSALGQEIMALRQAEKPVEEKLA